MSTAIEPSTTPAQNEQTPSPRDAYVFGCDIEGWSRFSPGEQRSHVSRLFRAIKGAVETLRRQVSEDGGDPLSDVVVVSSGDGAYVAFFGPVERRGHLPFMLAALVTHDCDVGTAPPFQAALVIHHGPVDVTHDPNGSPSFCDSGVIVAARLLEGARGWRLLVSNDCWGLVKGRKELRRLTAGICPNPIIDKNLQAHQVRNVHGNIEIPPDGSRAGFKVKVGNKATPPSRFDSAGLPLRVHSGFRLRDAGGLEAIGYHVWIRRAKDVIRERGLTCEMILAPAEHDHLFAYFVADAMGKPFCAIHTDDNASTSGLEPERYHPIKHQRQVIIVATVLSSGHYLKKLLGYLDDRTLRFHPGEPFVVTAVVWIATAKSGERHSNADPVRKLLARRRPTPQAIELSRLPPTAPESTGRGSR